MPQPKRNLTATLREWHKRAGLAACLFLAWLASSGILLSRSTDLGLDTARLDWGWLMAIYNLHPEPPSSGFSGGDHWLASTKELTVLDGKPLETKIEAPLGFVSGGTAKRPLLFVGSPESVVLLKPTGERDDELRSPILPVSSVRRIGVVHGKPGSVAVQDLDAYQSVDGGDTWETVSSKDVDWSGPAPLSEDQRGKLLPFSRPSVIIEQLLIDLHSGRLFGRFGSWVITTVGCLALWLALSGVWMWYRINQNRKRAAAPLAKR